MKTRLLPIMLTAVFTVNTFADVELKRKNINTVEDVKEYRAQVIDKMTERLIRVRSVVRVHPDPPFIFFFYTNQNVFRNPLWLKD